MKLLKTALIALILGGVHLGFTVAAGALDMEKWLTTVTGDAGESCSPPDTDASVGSE